MADKELRKRIGQLFLAGFEGKSVTPAVKELLTRYHVGGLVLFARNISEPGQAWELLRTLNSKDLFKAVDHEGGRVVRLPPPVTAFPPAARLGTVRSVEMARLAGLYQGRELAAIGFNLNFAPVLDLRTNPVNRVIGDRSFGADPELAGKLGAAFAAGLREAGVAACGKHFPGHGDSREDSHETLPRVAATEATLAARELLPFAAAVKGGIPCLMTAHVLYEGIDAKLPGTLSPAVVEGLVRRRLGFDGVVVTDDLEMRSITGRYDADEAAVLAIKAGCDMVMFCHSVDRQVAAIEGLYRAVDGRIIKPERIEQAWRRVQAMRAFTREVPVAPDRQQLLQVLNCDEHKALAASLAAAQGG